MSLLLIVTFTLVVALLTWAFCHIVAGIFRVRLYSEEINAAFKRNPDPFKPNQLWIVKTFMCLYWHKIDWLGEVFYYDCGLPEWRRTSQSN